MAIIRRRVLRLPCATLYFRAALESGRDCVSLSQPPVTRMIIA